MSWNKINMNKNDTNRGLARLDLKNSVFSLSFPLIQDKQAPELHSMTAEQTSTDKDKEMCATSSRQSVSMQKLCF